MVVARVEMKEEHDKQFQKRVTEIFTQYGELTLPEFKLSVVSRCYCCFSMSVMRGCCQKMTKARSRLLSFKKRMVNFQIAKAHQRSVPQGRERSHAATWQRSPPWHCTLVRSSRRLSPLVLPEWPRDLEGPFACCPANRT